MKKKFLLLMGIISVSTICAQVGINTKTPKGIFHIDAKGDTSGNANISDDIVVSSDGNIGVGTDVPTAKLDIRTTTVGGGFRLQDGTQGEGKILVTNANGAATWENFSPKAVGGVISRTDIALAIAPTYKHLGMYVTVPVGWSQVYAGGLVRSANNLGYITTKLTSSPTSEGTVPGVFINPSLAGFPVHTNTVVGQVVFFVENTTSAPVTLYLWGTLYGGAASGTWALVDVGEAYIFVAL